MGVNFSTSVNDSAALPLISTVEHSISNSPEPSKHAVPIETSAQPPPTNAERLTALELQLAQLSVELRDLADAQIRSREEIDAKLKQLELRVGNETQRLTHELHAKGMSCCCGGGGWQGQGQEEDDHDNDHRMPSVFGLVGSRRRRG